MPTTHENNLENEVKLRIDSPSQLCTKLEELGAVYQRTETQNDTYYRRPNGVGGENIRVRKVTTDTQEQYGYFTYKGPLNEDTRFLQRHEDETRVDNPEILKRFLGDVLGFCVSDQITKTRRYYALDNMHVGIDYVDGLGHFIEIEGEDEAITQLTEQLGLDVTQHINTSYSALRDSQ